MATPSFQNQTCKICGKVEIGHLGVGGAVTMLPFGWDLHEDKTVDRKGPMATVCSDSCKRKLKELNRVGRAQRMGF